MQKLLEETCLFDFSLQNSSLEDELSWKQIEKNMRNIILSYNRGEGKQTHKKNKPLYFDSTQKKTQYKMSPFQINTNSTTSQVTPFKTQSNEQTPLSAEKSSKQNRQNTNKYQLDDSIKQLEFGLLNNKQINKSLLDQNFILKNQNFLNRNLYNLKKQPYSEVKQIENFFQPYMKEADSTKQKNQKSFSCKNEETLKMKQNYDLQKCRSISSYIFPKEQKIKPSKSRQNNNNLIRYDAQNKKKAYVTTFSNQQIKQPRRTKSKTLFQNPLKIKIDSINKNDDEIQTKQNKENNNNNLKKFLVEGSAAYSNNLQKNKLKAINSRKNYFFQADQTKQEKRKKIDLVLPQITKKKLFLKQNQRNQSEQAKKQILKLAKTKSNSIGHLIFFCQRKQSQFQRIYQSKSQSIDLISKTQKIHQNSQIHLNLFKKNSYNQMKKEKQQIKKVYLSQLKSAKVKILSSNLQKKKLIQTADHHTKGKATQLMKNQNSKCFYKQSNINDQINDCQGNLESKQNVFSNVNKNINNRNKENRGMNKNSTLQHNLIFQKTPFNHNKNKLVILRK